jgi:hypothetical protein
MERVISTLESTVDALVRVTATGVVHAIRPASLYIFDPAYAATLSRKSMRAMAVANIASFEVRVPFKDVMAISYLLREGSRCAKACRKASKS